MKSFLNPTPIFWGVVVLLGTSVRQAAAAGVEKSLCEDLKKPFLQVACDKGGGCTASPARLESSAKNFQVPKPAGARRMFILGESAATLLGDGQDMSGNNPGFEAINCGMSGYESYRITGVFNEILKYEPDLIVLLSGNNEESGYPCEGLSFKMRRRLRGLLEKFYGWKSGAVPAAARASLKVHERRLAAMASEAKKRKIPLILCTLPANLGGVPPSGTPPLEKESFAAGMAAFENRKFEKAAGHFGEAIKEDGRDLFSRFYLAKTLAALRRFKEARENYRAALDLNARPERISPARNEMIRKVAARYGAGLCDLERAFDDVSPDGIPGFDQMADTMLWWPFYNGLVWGEIAEAADAMGLADFKNLPTYPSPRELTDDELRKIFSYALANMDGSPYGSVPASGQSGVLSEKSLAALEFLQARRPGLLEKAALSGEAFRGFFINNFWSQEIAARLDRLHPQFLAHLAESERRRGKFQKALSLADRALSAEPDILYFRPVRALALLGLGRKKEAEKELAALYPAPGLRKRVMIIGRAYGLALPDAEVTPGDILESKKLADSGVDKIKAGDLAAAQSLLKRAVELNPSDAGAFLSLCYVQFLKKDFSGALRSCDSARWGAESYDFPPLRKALLSDASYSKARTLAMMGRRVEAREELKKALKDPPPGWPNLDSAKAELEKLEKK